MYVGLPWIHARGQAMARIAADRLAAIDGVELLTPRDRMATLVTFRIARLDAGRGALDELGRADLRDRPDDPGARRAPDQRRVLHDRRGEIERVATTVELLAAHTPETLPAAADA